MVDIRQELEKKILESNQRQMSLSDRLNYLDNFNKDVAVPQISSPGPKGTNPMNSLNSIFQMITNRKAVAGDLEGERNTGLNVLSQMADLEKQNQPADPYDNIAKILDIEKKAKDVGKKLVIDENGGISFEDDTSKAEGKLQIVGLIDEILSRNTKPVTGALRVRGSIPGTEAAYTKQLLDQLKSKLSLDNRSMLKGTGTISDFEAKMLEEASSALNKNLSDTDLRKELEKLKNSFGGSTTTNSQSGGFTIEKVE